MISCFKAEKYIVSNFFNILSFDEVEAIKEYLLKVYSNFHPKQGLSIVFDITRWCNLSCRGCATNSRLYRDSAKLPDSLLEITRDDVYLILDQIKTYLKQHPNLPFYLNYGGGEPFLREDILEILKYSCFLFGRRSISLDTNGTIISIDLAHSVSRFIGCLGISLDGLETHHNYWRGSTKDFNAYQKTFDFLKTACEYPNLSNIIEVACIATKSSLEEIPVLIEKLSDIGVRNFSVHRAMPVGRFLGLMDEIPNNKEYLWLFAQLVKKAKLVNMNIHFHHTIESIYAALLLGIDTYTNKDISYNPDMRSSIGIDSQGFIYFDPWCTEKPWALLREGPLLKGNRTFSEILEANDTILSVAKLKSSKIYRCHGCTEQCSGGSRIAAASNYLLRCKTVNKKIILKGLEEVDPACPFYTVL